MRSILLILIALTASAQTHPAGSIQRTFDEKFGEMPSVKDFGAKGNGVKCYDASVNLSAPTHLISACAAFVASDAGKVFVLQGEGPTGGPLYGSIVSVAAGVATMSVSALGTASGLILDFGTDDAATLNLADLKVYGAGAGTRTVGPRHLLWPPGIYMTTATVANHAGVSWLGHNSTSTIVEAAAPGITVLAIDDPANTFTGSRDAIFEGIGVDCLNLGAIGAYVGRVELRKFGAFTTAHCTRAGTIVDAAQNNQFERITDTTSIVGIEVDNGAANNDFNVIEADRAHLIGLWCKNDPSLPGWIWMRNGLSLPDTGGCSHNTFSRLIFDGGDTAGLFDVLISNGSLNIFRDSDLAAKFPTGQAVIQISKGGADRAVCTITAGSTTLGCGDGTFGTDTSFSIKVPGAGASHGDLITKINAIPGGAFTLNTAASFGVTNVVATVGHAGCSMSAGGTTVTCSDPFLSWEAADPAVPSQGGLLIIVPGAGASGGPLVTRTRAVSSGVIAVADAASTAVSGAFVTVGSLGENAQNKFENIYTNSLGYGFSHYLNNAYETAISDPILAGSTAPGSIIQTSNVLYWDRVRGPNGWKILSLGPNGEAYNIHGRQRFTGGPGFLKETPGGTMLPYLNLDTYYAPVLESWNPNTQTWLNALGFPAKRLPPTGHGYQEGYTYDNFQHALDPATGLIGKTDSGDTVYTSGSCCVSAPAKFLYAPGLVQMNQSTSGNNTIYMIQDWAPPNTRMAMSFGMAAGAGTTPPVWAMAITKNTNASGNLLQSMVHLTWGTSVWGLTLWTGGVPVTTLGTGTFLSPVTVGGSYGAAMTVSAGTIYLELPDGTTQSYFVPTFINYVGGGIFWEESSTTTSYLPTITTIGARELNAIEAAPLAINALNLPTTGINLNLSGKLGIGNDAAHTYAPLHVHVGTDQNFQVLSYLSTPTFYSVADDNSTHAGLNLLASTVAILGNQTVSGPATMQSTATYSGLSVSGNLGVGVANGSIFAPLHVRVGTDQNLQVLTYGSQPTIYSVDDANTTMKPLNISASTTTMLGAAIVSGTATIQSTATYSGLSVYGNLGIGVLNGAIYAPIHVRLGTDQNFQVISDSGATAIASKNNANGAYTPLRILSDTTFASNVAITGTCTGCGVLIGTVSPEGHVVGVPFRDIYIQTGATTTDDMLWFKGANITGSTDGWVPHNHFSSIGPNGGFGTEMTANVGVGQAPPTTPGGGYLAVANWIGQNALQTTGAGMDITNPAYFAGNVQITGTLKLPSLTASLPLSLNSTKQVVSVKLPVLTTLDFAALTASMPLQLDASKQLISAPIDLATAQATGILGHTQVQYLGTASSDLQVQITAALARISTLEGYGLSGYTTHTHSVTIPTLSVNGGCSSGCGTVTGSTVSATTATGPP